MFSFIKRHWLPYLIGAALAIALGVGIAYLVGVKGSTRHHIDDRQSNTEIDIGSEDLQGSGSNEGS